jgi:hypothetical protein
MRYKTTLVAALLAACGILTSTAITAEPRSAPQAGANNSIVLPTNSDGILSQCGDYFTFNPDEEFYGVVPDEYEKEFIPVHPMIVPVYGYMVDREFKVDEATKLKLGENPYTIAEINRAMWDGHTFIWMEKNTDPETYEFIQNYVNTWNQTHEKKVIALTWKGDKQLPQNRELAFSNWNISQSCMSFSEATFNEFMKQAEEHNAGRDISALPIAKLTNGNLRR